MTNLTPPKIVAELDKYIIGQEEAKRAIAIALCTRERRKRLPPDLREEVMPKNILMIGPTGVGKTEIARRLSQMIKAPFIKVEATKFTEVGYVGKDVDSIISELVESAVMKVYDEKVKEVEGKAEKIAEEKLVTYLCQQLDRRKGRRIKGQIAVSVANRADQPGQAIISPKVVSKLLQSHQLDDQLVEIEIEDRSNAPAGDYGQDEDDDYYGDNGLRDVEGPVDDFKGIAKSLRKKRVSVKQARHILTRNEAGKLLDYSEVVEEAIARSQESGVVFIDELDKLTGPKIDVGRDISGEGVQRDLLPLLEGSTVMTRYGPVETDHVLFVTAGAFYQTKPSDLIPELQGRLPLRVELKALSQKDMEAILTQPANSLLRQYKALMAAEGVELEITKEGVAEIARLACLMNERVENVGARRLSTIMEKVLEDATFNASEKSGEKISVDADYVKTNIGRLVRDEDLNRYIL